MICGVASFAAAAFSTASFSTNAWDFDSVVEIELPSFAGDDEEKYTDDNQILMMVIKSFMSKQ